LSILWIDVICGFVQNSMTPPEKNVVRRVGTPSRAPPVTALNSVQSGQDNGQWVE
jgi:hypothetical protein